MKTRDWLILAALGVGAYILYKKVTAIPALLTSTGEAVGGTLFDWLNPNAGAQPVMLYTHFPGGAVHYVDSSQVAADGSFTYAGQLYTMANDVAGNHVAIAQGIS